MDRELGPIESRLLGAIVALGLMPVIGGVMCIVGALAVVAAAPVALLVLVLGCKARVQW